ncbi:hypothetical protein OEB99_11640 [Actinotalea sp. M2MS4P-6]|uniref:hypothetical protein n=1 Tax=Actinotalea sp. M2MS4P-6 TaxID=2983762 RepID=UPI0021E3A28E|nr:hypothetical protein [Actinotalea sp. M2MS4P-6]MCV2394960.1 hypothetical protein [Actinotalea sp. M2MS4P-6]
MFALSSGDDLGPTAQDPALADDLLDMSSIAEITAVDDHTVADLAVVPCAARPSTGFVHLDGPCRCFVGGPAPEFAPSPDLDRRAG